MNRSSAFRRERAQIAKLKAQRYLKLIAFPGKKTTALDPIQVGRMASCHCKPCSCHMCGNPRKHFGAVTMRERKSKESFLEEIEEAS